MGGKINTPGWNEGQFFFCALAGLGGGYVHTEFKYRWGNRPTYLQYNPTHQSSERERKKKTPTFIPSRGVNFPAPTIYPRVACTHRYPADLRRNLTLNPSQIDLPRTFIPIYLPGLRLSISLTLTVMASIRPLRLSRTSSVRS